MSQDSPGLFLNPTQAPCLTQFSPEHGDINDEEIANNYSSSHGAIIEHQHETMDEKCIKGESIKEEVLSVEPAIGQEEEEEEEEEEYLPLTFNCREDLNRKLLKVDMPKSSSTPEVSTRLKVQVQSKLEGRKRPQGNSSASIDTCKKVKEEVVEEESVPAQSNLHPAVTRSDSAIGKLQGEAQEENVDPSLCQQQHPLVYQQQMLPLRPVSNVQLLNKPPRLGLSKLQRKLSNLHEISIIDPEE